MSDVRCQISDIRLGVGSEREKMRCITIIIIINLMNRGTLPCARTFAHGEFAA